MYPDAPVTRQSSRSVSCGASVPTVLPPCVRRRDRSRRLSFEHRLRAVLARVADGRARAPLRRPGRGVGGAAPAHLFFAGGGSAGCAVRRILTGFTGARGSTDPPDPAGRSVFRRPPTRRTGPVRPAGGGVPPGRRVPAGPDVGPGTVAVVRPSART